jgi:hypothetical protein
MQKSPLSVTLLKGLGVLLLGFLCTQVFGKNSDFSFSSSRQRASLVELFTSQGCHSCPPAEKWLNHWEKHPGLWKKVVPLAYHVDYWDYLGWKDPYASKKYTQRQRQYYQQGYSESVYTPEFIVNGEEWKGWFHQENLPSFQEKAGILKGILREDSLYVTYTSNSSLRVPLNLHVAITGSNINTEVPKGENRGKILWQDFVVLHHSAYPTSTQTQTPSWSLLLPIEQLQKTIKSKYAISIWVVPNNSMIPLQATGSFVPQ